jgi:hypothetical protein
MSRPCDIFPRIALTLSILLGLIACNSRPVQSTSDNVPPVTNEPVHTAVSDSSDPVTTDVASCTDVNPHPIGQGIAETYDVSYDQVMIWFCRGYSFDNIMIALETGEAVNIPAETLLDMLLEKEWEDIWAEVGFVNEE